MQISTRIPNLARLFWVCPQDCNPGHVNIPRKRQIFNREHLILSVCLDFGFSGTQAKTHLRIHFFTKAPSGCFQMSVIVRERKKAKKKKKNSYLLCAWYAWNIVIAYCNCILKKLLQSIFQNFYYEIRKLSLLFTFVYIFL